MPARGKISILLVEHCSENLSWVEEHLSGLDIELFWASSGTEALGLARENEFVMALLGVNNPEDGVNTARLILSHPETQHLPIVFVSNGPNQVSLPLKTIGPGIVDYLTKPIEPLILHNKLRLFRELFHQRKAARQLIAALRETHAQLRKGKERYIRLLESVTSYVYSVTVSEGVPVFTVHGQGCEAVTGFSPEEYAADPELWIRMIPDEDRPAVLDTAESILSAVSPLTIEHRINHKDGRIHWVQNTLVPHFDLEATLVSYDGIIIDTTERKRAERTLAKSVSLLEATLESTADGILVVDREGAITRYNKKFLSLWRIPDAMALKRNDNDLIEYAMCQLKDPEHFVEKIRYLYSHPEAESFDLLEFADGRVIERYSKPQMMGDEVVGRVWSFRDITERKSLEEQLRQAQKMEAIGQLAGGIAHDFNNILTVILGYCGALQENFTTDDPLRENIDQILFAAERATNLTRSLLVFSRKQMMTPQTVELNEIVRTMKKLAGRIIGEDVRFKVSHGVKRLMIYADIGQIEQVLMNLITNARDAMPNGGELTVETQLVELGDDFVQAYGYGEPGPYAVLTVSDTGVGIDAEIRERIFEPFFTTKGFGKGTGLGLSIAYGIIRQHKGFVKVYSEPGRGTVFKIYFPIISGEGVSGYCESVSPPVGGTETILVADDDAGIRRTTASTLKGFGYDVILAEDGETAGERFREQSDAIDLVILDMLMPRKSGLEVGEEIQRVWPAVKTLFMSGYSQDILRSKGFSEGGSELLMKPFSRFDLARKVREVLDR
jgi:PAS domain S-box-containing protein